MKTIIIILASIIFIFAIVKVANSGISIEDINNFETCIQEQYGMSSTEYYSLTEKEPVCQ